MKFPPHPPALLFAALFLAALATPAASAEAMLPCAWQGDAAPWPLPPDGEITALPIAPGAARLQLETDSDRGGVEYCGAVVLATGWALTARHCVEGKIWRDLRITAGTDTLQLAGSGVQRHVIAAYCRHRNRGNVLGSDIALLRLTEPFPDAVATARLATFAGTSRAPLLFSGIVASWPVIYRNPKPQPVALSEFEVFAKDASGVLLARPAGEASPPCSGESGSALWQATPEGPVVRGILSAVSAASVGEAANSARDICRASDMLAHFTDTARQFAWIRETMDICDASPEACAMRP